MSFKSPRLNEDDPLTPPSSDERMDTGSESFRSQDTPNSVLSSDFEDKEPDNILRLQNPEEKEVLRLNEPETNHNVKTAVSKLKQELNDSLISKMSNLNLNSPKLENRPRNLGISPPKFSSTLTLTTNHPLMSLGSPEEVPKKEKEDKDLSLSSIEDERHNETNGYLYHPERNTSKNNLYFSENFVTADSQILGDSRLEMPPDIVRSSEKADRKRLIRLDSSCETPPRNMGLMLDGHRGDAAMLKFLDKNKVTGQSTPKSSNVDIPERDEYHSGVADWCESPSQLRKLPNFELPIEMSSSIGLHNTLDSPDVISSASTQEDRSAYQALLDPYTGSVALRHKVAKSPASLTRRKIQIPVEEDRCSLDSVSACSMESEEEPPPPEPRPEPQPHIHPPADSREQHSDDDDDTRRSKSTNTVSECSDPIPEYSAAEELSNERSWLSVPRGTSHATCDMKVIEPYKRVLSHGGYDARGAAVIVFSACHLPDCARPDYRYVMDNLFLYVIWSLERLVTEEYVLVYLHGSAGARRLPSFHWLHECYKLIDRRLRKSLKHVYLVHPTFWLKSFVILTKPFVSSKFFRKLSYVNSLDELTRLVPVEPNAIPELVKQYDSRR